MSLGPVLRNLRLERGLTLSELAEKTGSHVGNLSRIERDEERPSLALLYRISEGLDYNLSEIFATTESGEVDWRLAAINTLFISLLDSDRQLMLDFAALLANRSTSEENNLAHLPSDSHVAPEATKTVMTNTSPQDSFK